MTWKFAYYCLPKCALSLLNLPPKYHWWSLFDSDLDPVASLLVSEFSSPSVLEMMKVCLLVSSESAGDGNASCLVELRSQAKLSCPPLLSGKKQFVKLNFNTISLDSIKRRKKPVYESTRKIFIYLHRS